MRDGDPDRPSRARPVADAPALEPRAEALAKAWLLELVAAAPLAAAADLPLDALSREAPPLFAAVARALTSDAELDRLAPAGDLAPLAARVGALAGARDAAGALAAVEALRRAVWSAALAEAPRAPAALVADLADRLSTVCATIAAAALAPPAAAEPPRTEPDAAPEPLAADPPPQRPIRSFAPRREEPADERGADVERLAELARAAVEENLLRVEDLRERERDLEAELPLMRPPYAGRATVEPPPRVAEGDPRTHLAARATEFVDEGRPFAVLLVELDGIDDLLAADDGAAAAVEAAERALEDLVRPGDAIRRESPGRLWLTLPGAGPAGARALALRAAACVERAAGHRGRPLTASVGVAVCPRDGADSDSLAEHAEDTLLAAQAAGSHGAPPPAL